MRFTEYVIRFVRLASRYEEEVTGETRFGYTSAPFMDGTATRGPTLGSGITFGDDALGMRELTANAHRLEAWRQTKSYEYCVQVSRLLIATMVALTCWLPGRTFFKRKRPILSLASILFTNFLS